MEDLKKWLNTLEPELSENDILRTIEDRVANLMDLDIELLMSYMYRLDVLEIDIKQSMKLNHSQNMASVFAQLIWNRQKLRLETRKRFKQDPIDDEELML